MTRGAQARPHVTALPDSESAMPRRSGPSCLGKSVKKISSYLIGPEYINHRVAGLFKSPDFRMVERCVGRRRPPGGGSRFFLSAGCRACGADSGCPGGLRTRRLCLVSRTGERGCVGGMRRSARRRVHDGIEGLLWSGGVVSVGGGEVLEPALVAHDGDGRVGQAGQVARQVADMRPAAVLVVGEVAHVVEPVLESSIGLLLFQSKFPVFQLSIQHTETRQ